MEPNVAERWAMPDGTTSVCHLRHGGQWQHKPPVNGRELVAEDVPLILHRLLADQAHPLRSMLESVDRVEGVCKHPPLHFSDFVVG